MQPLTRPASESLRPYLPLPNELQQSYQPSSSNSISTRAIVERVLASIDCVHFSQLDCSPPAVDSTISSSPLLPPLWELLVKASRNTWSRAERRKKTAGATESDSTSPTAPPMLSCIIQEISSSGPTTGGGGHKNLVLRCSWIRGHDRALFESFWSHVSRKVAFALGES